MKFISHIMKFISHLVFMKDNFLRLYHGYIQSYPTRFIVDRAIRQTQNFSKSVKSVFQLFGFPLRTKPSSSLTKSLLVFSDFTPLGIFVPPVIHAVSKLFFLIAFSMSSLKVKKRAALLSHLPGPARLLFVVILKCCPKFY